MYFTALTAFRFPLDFADHLGDIDEALRLDALKPIGPQETITYGFVSPFGEGNEVLHHRIGNCILLCLGTEQRILPPRAIDRAVRAKVQEVQERENRIVGSRERRRLKEEIAFEMIPRAFTKFSRLSGYLDIASGTLFVDTASRKVAENMVSAIRRAYGSFPATPLQIGFAPRPIFTQWLTGAPIPARVAVGDEAELRDPVDKGAVIKAKRQELCSEEMQQHLQAGKQCVRIGLCHDERLTFVIDDALVVRRLKLTDIANDRMNETEPESAAQELDARFALFTGLVGHLATDLFDVFSVAAPAAASALKKAA